MERNRNWSGAPPFAGEQTMPKAGTLKIFLTLCFVAVSAGLLSAAEIHDAVKASDLEKIEKILQADPGQVNATEERIPTPLHVAAWWGQKAAAELLIAGGANPNARDKAELMIADGGFLGVEVRTGGTPLHLATYRGHTDVMELLIAKGANVNAADDGLWTPLHWATAYGRKACAELLITKGAVIDARDKEGQTPLHRAVAFTSHRDSLTIVELLVAKGADVNAKAATGETPLSIATKGYWERGVKFLVQHGATDQSGAGQIHDAAAAGDVGKLKALLDAEAKLANAGYMGWKTPLQRAAVSGHRQAAELLIARGADVNAGSPLVGTAANGHKDVVELLISKGADVNGRDPLGHTALHEAAYARHKDVVELLLNHGADITARDKEGCTPLHQAAKGGSKDVVALLIEKGADVHAKSTQGYTMVGDAASLGHKEVVDLLIAKGAEMDVCVKYVGTPLHQAADRGHAAVVQLLLSKGADLNADDGSGMTPLHRAAREGRNEAVAVLIAAGADVNARLRPGFNGKTPVSRPDDRMTPLSYAARGGHKDTVDLLLGKGADVNAGNALFEAASGGHEAVVEVLLAKGAVVAPECLKSAANADVARLLLDKEDAAGLAKAEHSSALHRAAERGDKKTVELLLAKGADVNALDGERMIDYQELTALHWAAFTGHADVAAALIAKGADINAGAGAGATPLHLAAAGSHKSVVELLISKGADANLKDKNDLTPLQRAEKQGQKDIVAFLDKYTAKPEAPTVVKGSWDEVFLAEREKAAEKAEPPFAKDVPCELLCHYDPQDHPGAMALFLPGICLTSVSPDGGKVAFVGRPGIVVLDLKDKSLRRVAAKAEIVSAMAFSRDGKSLAVACISGLDDMKAESPEGAEQSVTVTSLATGEDRTIMKVAVGLLWQEGKDSSLTTSLAWVDDKHVAAYHLNNMVPKILLLDVAGGEPKVPFDCAEAEKKWPRAPLIADAMESWTPLGEQVSATQDGRVYFCWKGRILRVDAKSGNAEQVCPCVTEGGFSNVKASWAGGRLVVSAGSPPEIGYVVFDEELRHGKGVCKFQLVSPVWSENFAVWFPDGKHLSLLRPMHHVLLTDAEGEKQVTIPLKEKSGCVGAWPLDDKWLVLLTANGVWRCDISAYVRELDAMPALTKPKYPDFSTPESALETWEEAQIRGDRKTMLDCLSHELRPKLESAWTEMEKKDAAKFEGLLRTGRACIVINRLLHPVGTGPAEVPEGLHRPELRRVEIKGDRATVFEYDRAELDLVKVGNEWRISSFGEEREGQQQKE